MNALVNLPDAQSDGIIPGVSPQIYSAEDFSQIAKFAHSRAGIVLAEGKRMLVYSRLAPMLRKTQCATFAEFLTRVAKDEELAVKTLEALTTNHTYFNREARHFEHFRKEVRPALIEQAQAGQPVRLWSAGCSSGEEIWTLMMVLLGEDRFQGRQLSRRNILALASDLASHAVTKAAAATYAAEAMNKIDAKLRENWCIEEGETVTIGAEARSLVRFRTLNLLGEWPLASNFDVVFCRNVMIYFDQKTKDKLVWRLADRLKPGGFLYIGHSERIGGPACDLLETMGPTIYRRRQR